MEKLCQRGADDNRDGDGCKVQWEGKSRQLVTAQLKKPFGPCQGSIIIIEMGHVETEGDICKIIIYSVYHPVVSSVRRYVQDVQYKERYCTSILISFYRIIPREAKKTYVLTMDGLWYARKYVYTGGHAIVS